MHQFKPKYVHWITSSVKTITSSVHLLTYNVYSTCSFLVSAELEIQQTDVVIQILGNVIDLRISTSDKE